MFGCAGSSLLRRLFFSCSDRGYSSCGARAAPGSGSSCSARAAGARASVVSALGLRGLVASWHVESSWNRDRPLHWPVLSTVPPGKSRPSNWTWPQKPTHHSAVWKHALKFSGRHSAVLFWCLDKILLEHMKPKLKHCYQKKKVKLIHGSIKWKSIVNIR